LRRTDCKNGSGETQEEEEEEEEEFHENEEVLPEGARVLTSES